MNEKIQVFLNEGIPTSILSIGVVFAMLILLILAIVLLGKIVAMIVEKSKPSIDNKSVNETVKENHVDTNNHDELSATVDGEDSLEIIAVITAVIAAQLETTTDRLVVKSLRKVERKTL